MRTPLLLTLALAACTGEPTETDVVEGPAACPQLGELVEGLDFGTVAIGGDNVLPLEIANTCEGQIALGIAATVGGDDTFTLEEDRVGIAAGAAGVLEIRFSPVDYDLHEAVLTLATTDPERPEATVRLTGQAGPDQDGDGFEAVEMGGTDCDDSDPNAFPGNSELRDLADNDCDGSFDEGFVQTGDLFVSEMMIRPAAVSDAAGEWIEIYNASDEPIELKGWHIGPSAALGFTVRDSLVLEPAAFAVFGAEDDPSLNGGVAVDQAWPSSSLALSDDAYTIALALDGASLFTVDYTTSWAHEEGSSLALDSDSFTGGKARYSSYWCASDAELPSGDRGTPGAANEWCASVDHDGDGATEAAGDCDDADSSVGPSATELWNGRDDDCDDAIDDLAITGAQASLLGSAGDYLGYASIAAGDLDGDDADEIVIGSHYGNGSHGRVYVLEAADWASWDGDKPADLDEAMFAPNDTWYMGNLPARFADHTGDGGNDLLVAGSDYTGTSSAWAVIEGPIAGGLDLTDAIVTGEDYASYAMGAVAAPDMDGDGTAEVAYGAAYGGTSYSGVVTVHDIAGASGEVAGADGEVYLTGGKASDYAGSALVAGDLDDDGYDDLVAGGFGYHGVIANGGGVYVLSGGSSYGATGALESSATLVIEGTTRGQYLGYEDSLAIADVDGDDALDIVAAAPYGGTVFVVLNAGSRSGSLEDVDADATVEEGSSTSFSYFGWTVTAGDLDVDGADEILLSTYGGAAPTTFVFSGLFSGAYTSDDAIATVSAATAADLIGSTLVSDLDADGTPEVVIATPSSSSAAGSVWFFDL